MNKAKIIIYLKQHKQLMNIIAFFYSLVHGSNVWRYVFNKNVTYRGAFLKRTKVYVDKNSKVYIGEKCQMNGCLINAQGGEVRISGSQTCINNTKLIIREPKGKIIIGEDFSMQGGIIQCVDGTSIQIGKHCMFSGDIDITSGDLHPIYNVQTKEIINHSKDITISDRVWIGAHVRVMKGVCITSNVIVGNSSLVNRALEQSYCVYAGIPAKKIKEGVDWARSDGVK